VSNWKARRRAASAPAIYRQFGKRWKRWNGKKWETLPNQRKWPPFPDPAPQQDRLVRTVADGMKGAVTRPAGEPPPERNFRIRSGGPLVGVAGHNQLPGREIALQPSDRSAHTGNLGVH